MSSSVCGAGNVLGCGCSRHLSQQRIRQHFNEGEQNNADTHSLPGLVAGVEKAADKKGLHSPPPGRYRPLLSARALASPSDSSSALGTPDSPRVSPRDYLRSRGNDTRLRRHQNRSWFAGATAFSVPTRSLRSAGS